MDWLIDKCFLFQVALVMVSPRNIRREAETVVRVFFHPVDWLLSSRCPSLCHPICWLGVGSCAVGVLFREFLTTPVSWQVASVFSARRLSISSVKLRYLAHFERSLVQVKVKNLLSCFCGWISIFFSAVCWQAVFFQCLFCHRCEKGNILLFCFWVLYSVSLSSCLFLYQH